MEMLQHVMTKPEGLSLTLFYINGRPDGIVTAEEFNWTGHVLTIPRTQLLKEGLALKEASHTGVYLLWGEDEEGPCAYIGESEDVKKRIKSHELSWSWWTHVAIITTAANNLDKAHVQYLESRLIEIAKKIGKIRIKNSNTPAPPSLSKAYQANMKTFLYNIRLVLPPLGINWFIDDTRPDSPASATKASDGGSGGSGGSGVDESPTFFLQLPKDDVRTTARRTTARHATARIEDGKFVVQKGSPARSEWVGAKHPSYTDLFNRLCKMRILKLVEDKSHSEFNENYAFDSPSAAGSVVTGYSCNGPQSWKTKDGKKYAQWEKEDLQSEKPESEAPGSEEIETEDPESKKPESKKPKRKKPKPKK